MLLYFRGCTAREKLNSISDATESLLKLFNIEYEILDDEKCCGSVLLRTGFKDDGIEQMKKTYLDLKGKTILTSCAGCYKTLKEDYKTYLDVDLDVIHVSQLLDDLINKNDFDLSELINNDLNKKDLDLSELINKDLDENDLDLSDLINKDLNENDLDLNKISNKDLKVTYHDPCHLGRHAGEYEAPRSLINAFSNLVEMENIRENSRCCGSGGGVKSAYDDLSNSIAKLRIKEAKETGADLLVSACPFCKLNLSQNSDDLEVLDLSEFVLKRIGGALNEGK